MKVKVNQKFEAEIENIDHIVSTSANTCKVYLTKGYPKILKTDCSRTNMLLRIANVGGWDIYLDLCESFKKK